MNVQPSENAKPATLAAKATKAARLRTDTAPWSDLSPGNIDALMLAIFKNMQADIAQRRYGLGDRQGKENSKNEGANP